MRSVGLGFVKEFAVTRWTDNRFCKTESDRDRGSPGNTSVVANVILSLLANLTLASLCNAKLTC